jgi:hypothetical protein
MLMRIPTCGRARWVVRVVLFSVLAACGDGPSGPRPAALCDGPVTVTVGSGTTPEFTWTPACRVEFLTVENVSDGTIMWVVLADPFTERAIVPPVRYGVVPADAIDLSFGMSLDLQAGTRYALTLTISGFPGGDVDVGRAEFVP